MNSDVWNAAIYEKTHSGWLRITLHLKKGKTYHIYLPNTKSLHNFCLACEAKIEVAIHL